MRPSFTKHVHRRTLPAWVTRGYQSMGNYMPVSGICDTPVYENGDGLAFGAKLEAGKIGCLNWMSRVDMQACQEVLREAKARRATGLYLPGKGHVSEFPVGDNDAIIEHLSEFDIYFDYKIRCVIFDVIHDPLVSKSDSTHTEINFVPKSEHVECDFSFGNACYDAMDNMVGVETSMHVSESARGIRLTLGCPLIMVCLYGFDDPYHEILMVKELDIEDESKWSLDADEYRRIHRLSSRFFEWHTKFLRVDEFDNPRIKSKIYDVEHGEDEYGPWTSRGIKQFKMDYKLLVVRGFYLPRTFQPEFWPRATEVEYRSLYNIFAEVLAAGVIQRAWRRVACNPNHKIGNRILRKEAERFSV